MEAWSPETIRAYYRDPEIAWLDVGYQCAIPAINEAGYYVMPHCAPECCRPSRPFKTADEARAWSAEQLAA